MDRARGWLIVAAISLLLACSEKSSPPVDSRTGDAPASDRGGDRRLAEGAPREGAIADSGPRRSFPLPATLDLGGEVSSVAVSDLDQDGYLDLVAIVVRLTGTQAGASLVVAWGDAAGAYAARYEHWLGQAMWTRDSSTAVLAIGDINGDQRPDLVTATGVATTTSKPRSFDYKPLPGATTELLQPVLLLATGQIYRGTTAGKVEACDLAGGSCASLPGQPEVCPPNTGCKIQDLVVGDFDGDGQPDIVGGGDPIEPPFAHFSRVWLSSKQWKDPVQIVGMHAEDMEAADVDGDGLTDVVAQQQETISDFPSYTDVWIATPLAPTGPFKKIQTIYNLDNHNDNAAVADMDADGCPDLMMIGVDTSAVGVRRGARQGAGGKKTCTGFLGPHDPSKPADVGWATYPGFAGTIGIQQLDVNGDDHPDWVIRTAFNNPKLHFLAVPKLP